MSKQIISASEAKELSIKSLIAKCSLYDKAIEAINEAIEKGETMANVELLGYSDDTTDFCRLEDILIYYGYRYEKYHVKDDEGNVTYWVLIGWFR